MTPTKTFTGTWILLYPVDSHVAYVAWDFATEDDAQLYAALTSELSK